MGHRLEMIQIRVFIICRPHSWTFSQNRNSRDDEEGCLHTEGHLKVHASNWLLVWSLKTCQSQLLHSILTDSRTLQPSVGEGLADLNFMFTGASLGTFPTIETMVHSAPLIYHLLGLQSKIVESCRRIHDTIRQIGMPLFSSSITSYKSPRYYLNSTVHLWSNLKVPVGWVNLLAISIIVLRQPNSSGTRPSRQTLLR